MIASFSNGFIFLKTRKTASTSVEMVLSTWCSGRDIVTPIYAPEEPHRQAMGGRPMNFRRPLHSPFTNHQTAAEVKRRLPRIWSRAFLFTVERHPYERVVSRTYWQIHRRGGDPYSEFGSELARVLDRGDLSNRSIYCIDDEVVVDEIVLYDQLWPRMAVIAKAFGRALPTNLPKAKSGYRVDSRPAHEILTDAQKERVYRLTRRDFAELGFAR